MIIIYKKQFTKEMMMRLTVDAWLERRNPRIRLLDSVTGQEVLQIGSERLRDLMEAGDLCLADLEPNDHLPEELIDVLLQQLADRRARFQRRLPSYIGNPRPQHGISGYSFFS
ncbi:MAG: hypothetical protein PVG66_07035 [Chromatiales bacterium]|jgi:hypothetical protein